MPNRFCKSCKLTPMFNPIKIRQAMNGEVLFITKAKGSITVEVDAPYRMSFLTGKGVRAATPCETLAALRVLRQNGSFGTLRLLAIFFKKSVMSLFRSSQQQLFTAQLNLNIWHQQR